MSLYVVLAPLPRDETSEPDPVRYAFVKDGFCWPCLFIAVLWMLYRRLWFVFLVYLAVMAGVVAAMHEIGGPLPAIFLVFWHFFFALQANAFRRWTMMRNGYTMVGVAEGRRVRDAEVRFFHEIAFPRRDARMPPPDRLNTALGGPMRGPSAESGDVVGFFPAPGGAS